MSESYELANAAPHDGPSNIGSFKEQAYMPSELTEMTASTPQKRDPPEDPTLSVPPVKRGRGRPRKHAIVNKDGTVLAGPPQNPLSLFKEALKSARKEPRPGGRRSERIQEVQEREEEKRQEEEALAGEAEVVPLYKPPTKYKLWDMQQDRILLAHGPTEMPPPHHGHFGDTLGFKGGNYTYEQNKRTYEAKIELAETAEFEMEEDEDPDKEEENHKATLEEREEIVEFVKSERWKENYEEWKENYDQWLNDPNE